MLQSNRLAPHALVDELLRVNQCQRKAKRWLVCEVDSGECPVQIVSSDEMSEKINLMFIIKLMQIENLVTESCLHILVA